MANNKDASQLVFMQGIIEQLPGNVYWKDIEGRYLGCNQNMADIFGHSRKYICGRTDHELMAIEFADALVALDKRVCTGKRTIMTEELGVDQNGNEMRYLSCKAPLLDDKGHVIGVIGTSLNIEEYKKNEQNLLEQQQQLEMSFKRVINVMPGNVYWKDAAGCYLGCNENTANLLGLESPEDIVGKRIEELMDSEHAARVAAVDQAIIEKNELVAIEEQGVDTHGEPAVYYTQKLPLTNHCGASQGLLGVSVDITQRKNAEQALQRAKERAERLGRSKSELILNMSHDLRTPCANILGLAKLIEEKNGNDIQREVASIVESSESLLILLDDILVAEKLNDIDHALLISRFNVAELISAAVNLVRSVVVRKKLVMRVDVESVATLQLLGDKNKLYRIVINLLSNAVKFTSHGAVSITVEKRVLSTSQVELTIVVKDSGMGIPEDKLADIFDKFNRLNPSYEGVYGGIGIGLTVVDKFVTMMKGDIKVNSELGKGSTFTVTLPFLLSTKATVHDDDFMLETFSSLRVLIVEDNAIARRITCDIFQDFGCKVTTANDAKQALALNLVRYDLVVLDIGLPDMDGCTLARSIKEQLVASSPLILGLTAHATIDCSENNLIDGMFNKPLTKDKAQQMLQLVFC